MNLKFYCPDFSDKRILYAKKHLEKINYESVNDDKNANFILLGVNPDRNQLNYNIPIFAGNINEDNIYDYTKCEAFAIKNAYLTAEGALAIAIEKSEKSLINSKILILGYGRIGKAIQKFLSPYTKNITVCARNIYQRTLAQCNGLKAVDFDELSYKNRFDFIFNTIPHPVINELELSQIEKDTFIIDLASFPGGVDKHYAKLNNNNLVIARGLPAKFSPIDAGIIVAQTVDSMIKGGII